LVERVGIKLTCRLHPLGAAKGGLEVGGAVMQPGDGAKIAEEALLQIKALAPDTEFLLFDLA
jgi:hypothetical protein